MRQFPHAKANGVHYTPPALARFLAEVTLGDLRVGGEGPVTVLDPASGEGGLLLAVAEAAPVTLRERLVLVGYETDGAALAEAGSRLDSAGVRRVVLERADFLTPGRFEGGTCDAVIANPPYVRTQTLGAARARELARRFGLSGRVDVYQAFVRAIASALRAGGTLGLLTSNRFLFIQAGAEVRGLLRAEFDLRAVYDLGDTRLFAASVLPAIVVARKGPAAPDAACRFTRVYERRALAGGDESGQTSPTILEALRAGASGVVGTDRGVFAIERGTLAPATGGDRPWTLSTPAVRRWLDRVESRRAGAFGDVGAVRVGIKTTADRVFIRDDWDGLPPGLRPEPELLRPLLVHDAAARWRARDGAPGGLRVLYPHRNHLGRRSAIDLDAYPRARAYLDSHREALEARTYVAAARRRWYEIWVPQDPDAWARPKVVFPDIAEAPRFFLDRSGAVVNGDCYWIAPEAGQDPRRLLLLLGVANSSFLSDYYDAVVHNQLYAGRRRFMTQYVRRFPLPAPDSAEARRVVALVAPLVAGEGGPEARADAEAAIDRLVREAFGVSHDRMMT